MKELCQPSINGQGRPLALIPIQATNLGLRHHTIQQVQNSCQFHGLPSDDANRHIDKFLEVTQHMKQNGVSDDALHLSLFPYSLTHHATAWNEIMNFRQDPNKSLFEAWERYKLSIDRSPNHNMLLVTQIDTFYNGLTLRHRDTINAAAGGTFIKKRPEECYDLIKNMTVYHKHWDTSATRDETSRTISSTTTTEIDYDVDPWVPLILWTPFLRTARALIDGDILYLQKLLNEDPSLNIPPMKNGDLMQADITMTKPSIEEPSKLKLKDLLSHLEYAFLEGTDKLPIIISKELKDEEKAALL
nr:reverse transcriptase domain-containing protein [Tanacetum cinerariifolium]